MSQRPAYEDSVLLVSDEPSETEPRRNFLASRGFAVHVTTGARAVQALAFRSYGLVIVDVGRPDVDGVALTRRALELDQQTHVLLIVHRGAMDRLVAGLRFGASDYVLTPVVPGELERKIRAYREADPRGFGESELIAESPTMKAVLSRAARACSVDLPVLIAGELGCGRKTIARAIHRFGATRAEPFVVVNLKSIPSHLIATELFGSRPHPDDAVTHYGVLGGAGRGAVFLENIDALPSAVQLKLIGVLDTGMIHPLGPRLDARLYCAPGGDLDALVARGLFQSTLHYRLDALRIAIPPLRERQEDIPALAVHFLRTFADAEASGEVVRGISPDALAALCHYSWPGNIRELANVMERAFVLAEDVVQLNHLPSHIASVTERAAPKPPTKDLDAE